MRFINALTTAVLAFASLATATAIDATGLEKRTSFSCPNTMTYCPWTRSCACSPGLSWSQSKGKCVGTPITGAWPKPSIDIYVDIDIELGTYCACSPYKIVKYDAGHEWCQVGLNNLVFLAPLEIEAEIELLGLNIDIEADISIGLKKTCAGLAGLYLENVLDAVALFNTDSYGRGVLPGGIIGGVVNGLVTTVNSLLCKLGLAKCNYDCVSYCAKGCGNYIDVVGTVGDLLRGLIGLCILPDVVKVVGSAGGVISIVVNDLLCIVGALLTSLLSIFNCNC